MQNTITLNGVDFTEYCLEIQEIEEITYSLDDTQKIVDKSISSEFTFVKAGYDYLLEQFFGEESESCDTIIDVVVTLGCCVDITLLYHINFESIQDCPQECQMLVNLVRVTTDNKAFNFLNRTRVLDNDAVNNIRTPHLEYCTGEGFRGFGAILFQIINAVFGSINLVIAAINLFIPGGGNDIPLLGGELIDGLLGCDKQAPSFVVPDVLNFQAGLAGLSFQSTTIFALPDYDKTTVLAMSFKEGINNCPDLALLLENRPNVTIVDFLSKLAPVFAAECRIRNGVLIFENETWFDDNLVNIGNIADMQFQPLEGVCYLFNLENTYASYGRFAYSYDAVDIFGNRITPKVNDIVEWNPDGLDSRRGEYFNNLPDFSPLYIFGMELQDISNPLNFLIGHAVIGGGQCSHWKIYQWDGVATCKARVIAPGFIPFNNSPWNYPFTFTEGQTQPSLYDNFHTHKDPENDICPMRTDDFTYFDDDFCGTMATLEVFGTDIYLDSPHGKITPSQVRVNLIEQTFTWLETKIIKY